MDKKTIIGTIMMLTAIVIAGIILFNLYWALGGLYSCFILYKLGYYLASVYKSNNIKIKI